MTSIIPRARVVAGQLSRDRVLTIAALLAGAYLLIAAVLAIGQAISLGTNFSGYAADGPFQLYNPLRRLAAGQTVGGDFPFFHGAGVLLVHFPLFALFGENIFAAEMSRWLVSPVFFYVSGFVFLFAVFRRWRVALVALVLYSALVIPMERMIEPSNSLLGVRTTLPILVAAALVWTPRRTKRLAGIFRADVPLALAIVAAGASVSFGTEQGLAACIAFMIIRLITSWRELRSAWRALLRTAVEGLLVLVAIVGWSTLLTAGHAPAALSYALQSIPLDQGWLFGSPPNTPLTWNALWVQLILWIGPRAPWAVLYVIYAGLAVLLVAFAVRRRNLSVSVVPAGSFLLLYGVGTLASIIGYVYLIDQLAPLGRVAALLVAAAAAGLVFRAAPRSVPRDAPAPLPRRAAKIVVAAIATVSVAMVGAGGLAQMRAIDAIPYGTAARAAVGAPALTDAELLGPGWSATLDEMKPYLSGSPTIWSTYSGLYESTEGIIGSQPGGEDYIIHAVGPERRDAYAQGFIDQRPDLAVTMNPGYFVYEQWLWSKYPAFYVQLLTNYDLVKSNPVHKLWARDDISTGGLSDRREVDISNESTVELPSNDTDDVQLWVVELEYDPDSGFSPLDRIPRYLLRPENTGLTLDLSLPWYETSWTVLVPVLPGQDSPRLVAATTGILPSASLDIRSAHASLLEPADPDNFELFVSTYCIDAREAAEARYCS